MAILKKGSKGSEVKALQTALNSNGARPKLDVDGDFGPLTEAAVKEFQKRAKIKTDGQAGDTTMAALKFGGPLPEMTVQDYVKRSAEFRKAFDFNQSNIESFSRMQAAAAKLTAVVSTEVPKMNTLFDANYDAHVKIAELAGKIVAKQAEFAKLLLKDPVKAATLVKECEALDKLLVGIGKTKISPNAQKNMVLAAGVSKALEEAYKVIGKELAEIEKRKEAF